MFGGTSIQIESDTVNVICWSSFPKFSCDHSIFMSTYCIRPQKFLKVYYLLRYVMNVIIIATESRKVGVRQWLKVNHISIQRLSLIRNESTKSSPQWHHFLPLVFACFTSTRCKFSLRKSKTTNHGYMLLGRDITQLIPNVVSSSQN